MRNVVVITLDSLRADHCSFLGYNRKTTPFLDDMAKDGLYFRNAVAPGTYTSESMIYAFTGQHSYIVPNAPGIEMAPEPWRKTISKRTTLANRLSEKGYSTLGFSPNPMTSRYYGFDKGFHYFEDFLEGKELKKPPSLIPKLVRFFSVKKNEFHMPWESYYETIVSKFKNVSSPFFLWVFLLDTHTPHHPPERNWSGPFTWWEMRLDSLLRTELLKRELKPREKKRFDLYDDSIKYADKFIGRLWEDLKDFDPVFIVHSDHGQAFGEHGIWGHTAYFYEEFIHIPLVIFNAGITGEIKEPATLDLSLIFGLIEGAEASTLTGGPAISKSFKSDGIGMAIRMGDWKFIHDAGEKLYNLRDDPGEQIDRVGEFPELENQFKRITNKSLNRDMEIIRVRSLASKVKKDLITER